MKTIIIIIFFAVFNIIFANDDSTKYRLYDESALILNKYDFKYSLLENAEYGISRNVSIEFHPLMIFLSPSLSVKYNFYKKNNLLISSTHGINCPTLLMSLVKREGPGGFISPEFEIPYLFSINNSIIATYILNKNHFLTGSLGLEFALNNSRLEPGTSVDLPIILPRSMVYYKNIGFNLKLIAEGYLIKDFDYHLKNEFFFFPINDDEYDYEYQETSNSFFWELSSDVFWNMYRSFKLGAGIKLCCGTYPFGVQWHLIPILDFVKYIE